MKKYILLLLIIAFNIIDSVALPVSDHAIAGLQEELKTAETFEEKKNILSKLANLHFNTSEEVDYYLELIRLCNDKSNVKIKISSYGAITRNYYNRGIRDSIAYYAEVLRPLAMEYEEYNEYSYTFAYLCYNHIADNNFEYALDIVKQLQQLTRLTDNFNFNFTYTVIMGKIYTKIEEYAKSLEYYQSALDILIENCNERISTKGQLYFYITELHLRMNNPDSALVYVNKFDELLNYDMTQNVPALPEIRCRKLNTVYSLFANILRNDADAAEVDIEILKNMPEVDDWYVEKSTHFAFFEFYIRLFDLEKANYELHEALRNRPDDIILLRRLYTLFGIQGNFEEANKILVDLYERQRNDYERRARIDVDNYFINEEINNLKSDSAFLKIKEQENIFYITIAMTAIVAIIIIIMILIYFRSRKMKAKLEVTRIELLRERNDLLKTKEMLESARDKANESNRLKSSFLANMSHEIRTPLNSIVGFSDIIASVSNDESKEKQYGEIIKMNADLLMNLINNILELSRIDSKRVNIEPSEIDITDFMYKIFDSFRSSLKNKNITCSFVSKEEKITVVSDPIKLKQVVVNILDNASKFTSKGEIMMEIIRNENSVRISIKDTGFGIPDEKKDLIFERFEKLDDFTPGAGLGLSISGSLMDNLGGKIWLDTSYTSGAAFNIEIPFSFIRLPD